MRNPTIDVIGPIAGVILILLRILQGLALGGEYGGAATYIAEHAPNGRRGYYTSWIQITATLGLFLSLGIILVTRSVIGETAFAAYGWRIPFLLSVVLVAVSLYIRISLRESPLFARLKQNDAIKFVALQGHGGPVDTCTVCHLTTPAGPGPHGLNPPQFAFTFAADQAGVTRPGTQALYR